MKRLFSLTAMILCAAMLTMTFTAAESDAYEVYRRSMKKMDSMSSVEMKATVKATMDLYGQTVDIKNNATIKYIIADNKLEMETHMADEGTGGNMDMYYKDGYLYQSIAGTKTKIKMSMDDALNSSSGLNFGFTRDMMRDATMEKVEGGNRIRCKIKSDDLAGIMTDAVSGMFSSAGMSGMKMTMSDINYSLLIGDDDMLKSYGMAYTSVFENKDITIKVKYNTTSKIVSVNKVTKIEFPSDLNTYKKA